MTPDVLFDREIPTINEILESIKLMNTTSTGAREGQVTVNGGPLEELGAYARFQLSNLKTTVTCINSI